MRLKVVFTWFFCGVMMNGVFGQNPGIQWLSFEKAEELHQQEKRPWLIDVYTNWCGWCKRLDATTFKDQNIVNYLNTHFYPVKFNAETRDTITFRDKTYVNTSTGRRATHQLARHLLDGRLSYPSIVYFDREFNKSVAGGYMKARDMQPLLIYFAESLNGVVPFEDFKKYFMQTFRPDSAYQAAPKGVVKWHTLPEALALSQQQPRKIFLYISADWVVSSQMMPVTFSNPLIAEYINKYYYPVSFNATTKDSLQAFGQTFVNDPNRTSIHQFANAMLNGNLKFPGLIWLDEDHKLMNRLQIYLTPVALEPILLYFGENAYKEATWKEYSGSFKSGL